MSEKGLLAAVTMLAVSAVTTFAANANPIYVGYSLNGGSTITQVGTSGADSTAGTGGTTVTAGGFQIQVAATGQSAGALTSLFSNTLTVSSSTAGSIIIYASETNNTARAATFTTGFGNNSLSTASVIESSYLGLANSPFSTSSPFALSTATVAPGQAMANLTVNAPANLSALYSLTESYAITFGASGGRVDATLGVISTAPVPEPVSIAILGTGLIGLGMLRYRNRI